eukprot:TRINITY_DN7383_c0_g1_i7.p1 TRINITY_DN7383_c0_g1~~TRINITY_DN7383_c0_g1_i7.p1  ORF type:complete len:154 (-),score=35.55 TRINITY_DN7383_c0_g1_i7:206-667(-)
MINSGFPLRPISLYAPEFLTNPLWRLPYIRYPPVPSVFGRPQPAPVAFHPKPLPKAELSAKCRTLKKEEEIEEKLESILASVRSSSKKGIKKAQTSVRPRVRKTKEQIEILLKEMNGETELDKKRIEEVAMKCKLKVSQIYKWYWDRRNKATS